MDLRTHMRDQLRKALVQRAIFCPISGQVLDVRTCVTLLDEDGDPAYVLHEAGWVRFQHTEKWAELQAKGYTVDVPAKHGVFVLDSFDQIKDGDDK